MKTISTMAVSLGLATALLVTTAFAHGDHDPDQAVRHIARGFDDDFCPAHEGSYFFD